MFLNPRGDLSMCAGCCKTLEGSLVFCSVFAPFLIYTALNQSKQIKVLEGITSQNTAFLYHEYNIHQCKKSKDSGELAESWQQQGLSFSKISIKSASELSVSKQRRMLYPQRIMSWYMQSNTECLELVPCQSPSKLNWEEDRCQWVERRHPRKWYCKCKITQCKKCKSTGGNWAIIVEVERADAGGG